MPYEYTIDEMDEESIVAECGPMRLIIRAWKKNEPRLGLVRQAAEESLLFLERVAHRQNRLKKPWQQIETIPQEALARRMLESVKTIGDEDLTPMAAVAGTIADAVADWLFERETTRVIVDNGGDIAIRLARGESATVGIRPQINNPTISHMINLYAGGPMWGVTTSGLGGRSFTRGIASAVSVLATSASIADAAATAIANACYVTDDNIMRIEAEKIDPHTDLIGMRITNKVGPLSPTSIRKAIDPAMQKAELLTKKKIIRGAFIALGGIYTVTEGMKPYLIATNN